jgi:hypothetical protein
MNNGGFFRQLVSGANGIVSSKRVMGMLVLCICLICIIYLVISEGGTAVVENLLQTGMVMAASLLGISSVTSIWKGNQVSMGDNSKGSSESSIEPQQPEQPQINVTVECPRGRDRHCHE